MTNKELAAQIYCSLLQATSTVASKGGGMKFPSHDDIVKEIKSLTEKLATIDAE